MKSDREMIASVMHEVDEYERRSKMLKKKTAMSIAAIVCILVCLGTAVGAVTEYFNFGGIKTPVDIRENILNAGSAEGVEEFNKEYEKTEDPFSVAARESGAGAHIILDYEDSIEYTDVIDEDEGYRFELKSVTRATQKKNVMVDGSIADGTAAYEWQISDGYYALVDISRCDGEKLGENDKARIGYYWSYLLAGYDPWTTNLHFRGYTVHCYSDDYAEHYAIEITDMMPFAGTDFALVAFGMDFDGDRGPVDPSIDTVYADSEGKIELVNEDEYFGALLRFSVPDKFASEDEHYAEKYFEATPSQLEKRFEGYVNPKWE
ncbi:MAG: hypothetical protein IJO73_09635 [Clostridia bacterium]|nr:hypothetical protein [Clostridia bacterium]